MNINGIEVLNQTEIIEHTITPNTFTIAAILTIAAVLFVFLGCYYRSTRGAWSGLIAAAAAMFGLAGMLFVFRSVTHPKEVYTGRYEYEALIDDAVSIKEVYEEYEIVDAKGDIYILRDLEPNNRSHE